MTPNLQVLTLDYQGVDSRTDGWKPKKSEDIVTCTSLRRIHVYDLALLRSFNLSSLEELAVEDLTSDLGAGNDDKKAEDIFYDFLLVDLDVTLPSPDTATLFFWALLSTGDKTDVLPELQSLKAEYRTTTYVKDLVEVDDIADMIVSRYHPPNAAVTKIQSVHIASPCISLLHRQSFQAPLKNLPELVNFISARERYTIVEATSAFGKEECGGDSGRIGLDWFHAGADVMSEYRAVLIVGDISQVHAVVETEETSQVG
ncbi:hypothetical protein F5146DRAFT_1002543 [Armillaria mellea]|nr:hypothetical protein F5146DRAFT_1002543 [Armillaria mellea]